jgi:hypothetical protein
MKELSLMLSGHGKFGKYGNHGPMVPLLRLVAFVVFCVDGDNGAGHVANGNAASIGAKKTANIKNYARNCVVSLRKAYEVSAAQARANGEEAERRFEKCIKVALMPEYVVRAQIVLQHHLHFHDCDLLFTLIQTRCHMLFIFFLFEGKHHLLGKAIIQRKLVSKPPGKKIKTTLLRPDSES